MQKKESRRNFLKKLGKLFIGAPLLKFPNENSKPSESILISTIKQRILLNKILENWDETKNQLLIKLSIEEFVEFRNIVKKNQNLKEKNKLEKKLSDIYDYIKYKYLAELTRKKIKQNLHKFDSNKEIVLKFIYDKERTIDENTIYFARLHKDLARIFLEKAKLYNIEPKLIFVIALIETNFGRENFESSTGAKGIMQIKTDTIKTVERNYRNIYELIPPYDSLNDNDKKWRELITGILNIKLIIEKAGLDISKKIDIYLLFMCYNQGLNGILEEFEKDDFPLDAINYIKKAESILSYKFDYFSL